jgi:hypothetical protein
MFLICGGRIELFYHRITLLDDASRVQEKMARKADLCCAESKQPHLLANKERTLAFPRGLLLHITLFDPFIHTINLKLNKYEVVTLE